MGLTAKKDRKGLLFLQQALFIEKGRCKLY